MITLAICGVNEVSRFAGAGLTDIVSIGDPSTHPDICAPQPPPDFSVFPPDTRVHRLEFQDICHVSPTSPSPDIVQCLVGIADSFIASKDDVRVLYHCQAGIARSTAAAFILCVRAGMTYQQAYDHILRVRGVLNPNMLMIKYADDLMNKGGEMLRFVLNHRWDGEKGNKDAWEWATTNGYANP